MVDKTDPNIFDPKICFEDDGKQKWESVTARIDLNLPYPFHATVEAHGEDEKEARVNLLKELAGIIHEFNTKYNKLIEHNKGE